MEELEVEEVDFTHHQLSSEDDDDIPNDRRDNGVAGPSTNFTFDTLKVIRNKQTGQSESYGFIEFVSRAAAERVLQSFNGTVMPNTEQNFRLNWATLGSGEKRADDGTDYTIFVGDLASDVSDYTLQETFKTHYPSVKGAKVVTDRITGRSKRAMGLSSLLMKVSKCAP
ncbi:hypothetical protein IFM89_003114 [Coptis chinensis]|uniref:RRM domain-containing protein n=1 Tax=Coptis chinensis TaxID=261450 RepID=A0A835M8E5_9MAGN|nr:hypothetical protein IFM89_003114 [Coptis chinensis]